MRPLKLNPGHAVTALALAPDGAKLGVVQSTHGFRLLDTVGGAELGRDTGHGGVYETAPTGRHVLYADRAEVRLAEVAAGQQFMRFQTGWTRVGDRNRPPAESVTSALRLCSSIAAHDGFDRSARPVGRGRPPATAWAFLQACALTADHRFAVGRDLANGPRFVVCDLAEEALVASNLDLGASRSGYEPVQFAFTPDETGVLAVTARALFVFDLPPSEPPAPKWEPLAGVGRLVLPAPPAPVLAPSAVVRVTQPQPDPNPPPFAVLPCGTKALVRGEKSRVELRDLASGAVLTEWRWGLPKLHALAVAGDGLTAAAGGASGQVVLWDLG